MKGQTLWEGQFIRVTVEETNTHVTIGNIYIPPRYVNENYQQFTEEFTRQLAKMLPVTPSSKSSMHTKNKIGPSTDPWDTPLKTDFQLETSPSTTTLCLLSVSHCSIQVIILFPIPCDFNLSISL